MLVSNSHLKQSQAGALQGAWKSGYYKVSNEDVACHEQNVAGY